MYRFVCTHLSKSRNISGTCKKISQSTRYHFSNSKPSSSSATRERSEEPEDTNNNETSAENSNRPVTCPAKLQHVHVCTKTFGLGNVKNASHLAEHPKLYTNNFLTVNPPVPSISKKYFHIYSISKDRIPIDDPAIPVKRLYSGYSYRHLGTDELDNYKMALHDLQRIKSQKLDSQWRPKTSGSYKSSSAHSSSMWLKTRKRHTSKTDISYPTHTINHHLKLNKRYRIREGATDCQVDVLEQALISSKKMEEQMQRVTQCLDAKYSKKGKMITNKPKRENLINITISKKKSTSSAKARKSQKSQERPEVSPTAQSYIQYHPTIKNASKEVKMRLKRKYVQLLLKPSKQQGLLSSNWNQPEVKDELEEEPYQDDNVKAEETNAEEANFSEFEKEAVAQPAEIVMAEMEDHVESARYPQRVYVDISTPYEIDKVCLITKSDKHSSEAQKVSRSEILDENTEAIQPTSNQRGPKVQKAQINLANMEKDLENTNKFIKELTDLEDRNLGSLAEQVRISKKIDQLMQHREKITQELRSLIAVPGKKNEVAEPRIKPPEKTEIEPLEYDEIENLNSEAVKKNQRANRLRRIMEHHSIIEERNAQMELQKPKINTRKSSIMKNIGELLEKNKRRDQVKQELLDLELGNIKPLSRSEEERMIQKHPQMKSIQAKPAAPETTEASSYLEEPDEVEELNEKASAKVRMARHQNMLRRQQMEIDKLKEQMAAVVATPTVEKESPKGDKKIAVLVEKNNRAERVREKIENFNDSTTGREKEHATRVTRPRQDVKPMKEDSRAEPTTERSDEITTETEIHKKVPASKIEDTVKKILNAVLLNQIIPPVKSELQQEDVEKESEEKLCSLANENMKSSKDKKNDKIKRIEEPTKNQTQDSQNGTHNSPQKEAISPKQQKEPVCSIPTLKEKDPSEDDEDLDVVLVRDRENQNKEVTAKERPKEVPSHDLKEKTSTNQETLQCRYQKLLSELGIKNINGIVPVDVAKELEPIPIKTKKEIQPVCETTGIMINPNLTQQEYKSDMNQNKNSVIQLKSSKETGTVKEENIKDLIIQPNLEAKDITKIDPKKADLSVNITDAIKTVMLDDTLHTVEKLNETPLKYYVSTNNAIEKTTEKPLECRVEIGAPNSIFSGKNVSGKTTENPLECRVDNLISTCKKVPEILTISNINETVMKEYFMEKILPGTFETIYLPKSEVVVNFKNEPMEAKTYIGHAQCPVNDNKGSSINESKNVEDKIKKKVIKLKDGISELYTRVKRKSSREMTMKQFEMSAGDSEQKADKAKDNENVKMNEGINIKNIEKSCENKTQTEVLDTKPSSTSSKQSYPKNSVSRLGNKIRVPPPVRPPSGKDKEKRKKDKPKGKKDMVLPPKRKDGDTGAVLSGKSYKPESSKNSEKNTAEKISGLEGNKLIKSTNDLQQTKGTLEVQRDTTVGQTSKTEPQKKDSSKTVVATSEKIDKMEEKKPLKSLDNYKYEEEKSETQRDVVLPNKLSLNSVAPQASQQVHELKTNVTNTGRILNLQENKPISGEYKHEKDKFKEQKNIATHPLRASEKTSHQGYSAKSSGTDVERAFNLGENKSTKSLDIIPPLGASEKKSHLGYSAKSSGTDIERPSNFGENNSTKSLGIVPSLGASEKTSHQGYSAKSSGTDVERASNFGENKSTKSRDIVPPLGASEKKSHLGCSAKSCGTDTERPSSFGENKSTKSLGFAPSLGASEKTSNQGYSAKSSGTDAERASNLGENKSTKSLDIVPSLGASEKKSHQGYSAKSNGTDTERASNFGENKSTKSLGFAPPLGASEKTSHQGYSAKSSGTDTERASNYGENKSTKSLGIFLL
ncbi:centromere-associated protein E-like isoform X2 [Sitophilus oryzae]|uniref:Centromere-associated protein E-like isoform X2 n=1 Tax=Sitophilus oryzae TaxID=7048 RepID=A0A6J2YJR5_SITOR|nr:centromere-associated protein E-like isoform X2 [Sitophilus oryzae]